MCHFLAPAGQPEMMHKNFMHQHLRIFVVQCSCMKFYFYSSNLLAANGLSKPFADGKSTGDSRFSGARGCSHLDGTK